MKTIVLLLLIASCGKPGSPGERCRSSEEMQMKCQIDYAENYQAFQIPDWVKTQCKSYYPTPGCYFDSSKREIW